MANSPWWQQLGDQVGFPGVAAAGYGAARVAPSLLSKLAQYGLGVGGSLAAAPVAAALTGASVMQPTDANGGEQPLYVQNAQGQWVPNPANPTATAAMAKNPNTAVPWQANGQNAPMNPFPLINPWPMQPNGMNASAPPMNSTPTFPQQQQPPAAAQASAGAPPAGVPLPQPRPVLSSAPAQPSAPLNIVPQTPPPNFPGDINYDTMLGNTGGVGQSPNANSNSLIKKFMDALHGGALPQMAQQMQQPQQQNNNLFGTQSGGQQQQGLLPKLFGDVSKIGSLFGGGGSASLGASMSNPTLIGSLY